MIDILVVATLQDVRQDESSAILSRSFGQVADEYNRLRSGPSNEALDWLIPDDATDVLEIGAGTGILTRLLADPGPSCDSRRARRAHASGAGRR